MSQDFYLDRSLYLGEDNVVSRDIQVRDTDLLKKRDLVVVLAEPGAGKTELLKYFARTSGAWYIRASTFRNKSPQDTPRLLLIDAMDELSRIGGAVAQDIIAKARDVGAEKVIFASRSSEWGKAHTWDIIDAFDKKPTIARLVAFSPTEQQRLFKHDHPQEDFTHFLQEAKRVDLAPLLGNPQLLDLFTNAYIQADRRFKDKKSIFQDAMKQLAREEDRQRHSRDRPSANVLVAYAQEVFAKLLLSGATGVSTHEAVSDSEFPYLPTLIQRENANVFDLLNSKLFKPATETDQHEPVHRIIAEYGAACFLTERIRKPEDLLTQTRCFSLIAPNGTVYDELRGLLGWMACLGDEETQRQAIALDPYAVLANGDPSRLLSSSKMALFSALKNLSENEPFFRRGDWQRDFSVSGFFTGDVITQCKSLLRDQPDQTDLEQI